MVCLRKALSAGLSLKKDLVLVGSWILKASLLSKVLQQGFAWVIATGETLVVHSILTPLNLRC